MFVNMAVEVLPGTIVLGSILVHLLNFIAKNPLLQSIKPIGHY